MSKHFVALAVGKLSKRKRPGDLLQAVEAIRDAGASRASVHAVYAGNGALLDVLSAEAKAKKCRQRLGFVNGIDCQRLTEWDILVHTRI